jgi:hypothetical protein
MDGVYSFVSFYPIHFHPGISLMVLPSLWNFREVQLIHGFKQALYFPLFAFCLQPFALSLQPFALSLSPSALPYFPFLQFLRMLLKLVKAFWF